MPHESVTPNEKQMEFFYENKFAQENGLIITEGDVQYKNKVLSPVLSAALDVNDITLFEDAIEIVKSYLATKKIKDIFTNHHERRDWRKRMSAKYGKPFIDFYQNDKYRTNKVIATIEWLKTCFECTEQISDENLKSSLNKLSSILPDYSSYNSMTPAEKNILLNTVDKIAIGFLDLLTVDK